MNMETWRPVVGFENVYEVSDLGNVRSLERKVWNRYSYISRPASALSKRTHKQGYLRVKFCINSKAKMFLVHRLVAEAFIPNTYNKREVNHRDGNKSNNSVLNLEWVSARENIQHAIKSNLIHPAKGEDASISKLTEKDVLDLRAKRDTKSLKELSVEYKVSLSNISAICNRKTWRHV